jgi:hypothetical protein
MKNSTHVFPADDCEIDALGGEKNRFCPLAIHLKFKFFLLSLRRKKRHVIVVARPFMKAGIKVSQKKKKAHYALQ